VLVDRGEHRVAADVGDHLAGEPVEVKVVGDDTGVRQCVLDRGPVAGAGIDRHEPDSRLPALFALIEPAHDGLRGPAGGLTEQPARVLGMPRNAARWRRITVTASSMTARSVSLAWPRSPSMRPMSRRIRVISACR
jgi:hypothetical protein